MEAKRKETIVQFIKYGLVGVMNTLVTLGVIYVAKTFCGVPLMGANALGYICGLINSFLWNKAWVFHSKKGFTGEALKFICGFAVCYALQFAVVWALNYQAPLGGMEWDTCGLTFSGYAVATLIGNVVYTIANFIYNRTVTFK